MRPGGAGCSAGLLLMVGWLYLAGFQAACGTKTNVTTIQDPRFVQPGLAPTEGESEEENYHENENEGEVELEDDHDRDSDSDSDSENLPHPEEEEDVSNMKVVKEVEYGMCTVTCGIGIREVILTNGCPGGESKCIVRVEECHGPVDCGWGTPISEGLESVRIACVHIAPQNRFKYVWKLLRPEQQPIILANDSAILEVHRQIHPMAFECDTYQENEIIASIKFTVYTSTDLQMQRSRRPDTDAVLVFVLTIGVVMCIFVIFVLIFIIINWAAVKSFWGTKASAAEVQSELAPVKRKESISISHSQAEMHRHEDDALSEWNE